MPNKRQFIYVTKRLFSEGIVPSTVRNVALA